MIELIDVGVRYPRPDGPPVEALAEIDLAVATGEVLAVIGPSGCGKSTLLRAVAGLEPLSSGSIRVDGRDLAGVPPHERGMGLMFQSHALFPHLDVAGNVAFGLQRLDRPARRARVAELLELVGLPGTGDRRIDQLSGGEAQRVALARALAPAPGILMLDEPLGSLDRALRSQLTVELRRLVTELGVTTIHVTHDQSEAFVLADRVAILRDGRIEQVGAPAELWRRPNSVFVAAFLGHENLWARSEGVILAPLTAIRLVGDSTGDAAAGRLERRARVERVTFREGRYRIRARSIDEHPDEIIVLESETAVHDDTIAVTVRRDAVVCLAA